MKTRSQEELELAARLVTSATEKHKLGSSARNIYGGLCHSFPILVLHSGLAQAIAFHQDKATPSDTADTPRVEAHGLLLSHIKEVLGMKELNEEIAALSIMDYRNATRRVLSAWVFFKRFAVSILKVEAGQDEVKE
jgi:CRISPR-associated protein Cmr5